MLNNMSNKKLQSLFIKRLEDLIENKGSYKSKTIEKILDEILKKGMRSLEKETYIQNVALYFLYCVENKKYSIVDLILDTNELCDDDIFVAAISGRLSGCILAGLYISNRLICDIDALIKSFFEGSEKDDKGMSVKLIRYLYRHAQKSSVQYYIALFKENIADLNLIDSMICVRRIKEEDYDLNERYEPGGRNFLIDACIFGNSSLVRVLIYCGVDVSVRDDKNHSIFYWLTRFNQGLIIRYLLVNQDIKVDLKEIRIEFEQENAIEFKQDPGYRHLMDVLLTRELQNSSYEDKFTASAMCGSVKNFLINRVSFLLVGQSIDHKHRYSIQDILNSLTDVSNSELDYEDRGKKIYYYCCQRVKEELDENEKLKTYKKIT